MQPNLGAITYERKAVQTGWIPCHQGGDKFAEQGFAAAAGVMHELEEAEVERQLLLRDAAVRP